MGASLAYAPRRRNSSRRKAAFLCGAVVAVALQTAVAQTPTPTDTPSPSPSPTVSPNPSSPPATTQDVVAVSDAVHQTNLFMLFLGGFLFVAVLTRGVEP
jgi:hypothetical protein